VKEFKQWHHRGYLRIYPLPFKLHNKTAIKRNIFSYNKQEKHQLKILNALHGKQKNLRKKSVVIKLTNKDFKNFKNF